MTITIPRIEGAGSNKNQKLLSIFLRNLCKLKFGHLKGKGRWAIYKPLMELFFNLSLDIFWESRGRWLKSKLLWNFCYFEMRLEKSSINKSKDRGGGSPCINNFLTFHKKLILKIILPSSPYIQFSRKNGFSTHMPLLRLLLKVLLEQAIKCQMQIWPKKEIPTKLNVWTKR